MGWVFDSEEEKNFKKAIEEVRLNGTFVSKTKKGSYGERWHFDICRNGLNEKLGKKFLASLEQMQSLIDANPAFWKGFIEAAADVIQYEENEEHIKELYSYLNRLENEWSELRTYKLTPKLSTGCHFFGFAAGVSLGIGGTAMLYYIVAGSLTLAMGPWAAAGLAVGLVLIGLILAAYEGHQVYKNMR
ncbi:MAG: hypothetical protein H0U70_06835 [Tatlockia sp.]|nr:hypothetical protein [Tatlockia sp.]